MTKFGEISPLWLNFHYLGQCFEGLFSIWQYFQSNLGKNLAIVSIFIIVTGQILKKSNQTGFTPDFIISKLTKSKSYKGLMVVTYDSKVTLTRNLQSLLLYSRNL